MLLVGLLSIVAAASEIEALLEPVFACMLAIAALIGGLLALPRMKEQIAFAEPAPGGATRETAGQTAARLVGLAIASVILSAILISAQFTLFHVASTSAGAGVDFGIVFTLGVGGGLACIGFLDIFMAVWTRRLERERGVVVLSEAWPRRRSGPPARSGSRFYVAAATRLELEGLRSQGFS
jgi:hypothetical protein